MVLLGPGAVCGWVDEDFRGRFLNARLSSRVDSGSTAEYSVVGGPGPRNAVTEDPPDICGGGQAGMAQTVSSLTGISGSTRAGITSNGLQAPSASHLGPVQLLSRLVGTNLSVSFRFVNRLGGQLTPLRSRLPH